MEEIPVFSFHQGIGKSVPFTGAVLIILPALPKDGAESFVPPSQSISLKKRCNIYIFIYVVCTGFNLPKTL